MDSSAYFERLLRYYEGSFDITRPALLGGSDDYHCTKQQELDDITRFMRSWRD